MARLSKDVAATRRTAAALVVLVATGVVALSVHVVLQQLAGVPFPQVADVPLWARLLRPVSATFALMYFFRWSRVRDPRRGAISQMLWVFVAYAAMLQTLRGALMAGIVTTAVPYHVASGVGTLLSTGVLIVAVAIVTRFVRSWWTLGVIAFVVAVPKTLFLDPFVGAQVDHLITSFAGLADHAEVYPMPYGAKILVWAYSTYVEPVAGAALGAWMVLPALHRLRPGLQVAAFAALSAALAAQFVPPLLWTWFMPLPLGTAFMSTFQFTLEYAVLGAGAMLAVRTWQGTAEFESRAPDLRAA